MSIITFGWPVHWAIDIATEMAQQGISVEIVDLRSLAPIDWSTLLGSVKKYRASCKPSKANSLAKLWQKPVDDVDE